MFFLFEIDRDDCDMENNFFELMHLYHIIEMNNLYIDLDKFIFETLFSSVIHQIASVFNVLICVSNRPISSRVSNSSSPLSSNFLAYS